ncbi:hypothetical protein GCM10028796_31580 [Ramlibacter monticola]|uniref:Uncharacterized protein n=1 Tax=Ramlibacter monticola TaxID=1926872 RepID=A0A936Z3C2_9BURK|nr:hypothetical protein [Ramlibacter monticola]MBL0394268.1 hypothetical protein [Ramlibacter monticola]
MNLTGWSGAHSGKREGAMVVKYTGKLGRRLPPLGLDAAARGSKEWERLFNADFGRKWQKFELLLKRFGLSIEGKTETETAEVYFSLAFLLAEAHVPGFQETKRSGRPQVWNDGLRRKAEEALRRLHAEHPKENRRKLADRLFQDPSWRTLSRTPDALLRQVRKLKTAHPVAEPRAEEISLMNALRGTKLRAD